MNKKILTIIFFLNFFVTSNIYSQEKLAFIDINYIFNNSDAGKMINKEINEKNKKINNEFNEYQKKFDSEKKTLLTQKNVLSKEEYKKKFLKLEQDLNDFNFSIKKRNDELASFQIKTRAEFFDKLRPILEEYSKQNGISIILKKENILIGKTNLDISKNILDIFDKQIKKISVN